MAGMHPIPYLLRRRPAGRAPTPQHGRPEGSAQPPSALVAAGGAPPHPAARARERGGEGVTIFEGDSRSTPSLARPLRRHVAAGRKERIPVGTGGEATKVWGHPPLTKVLASFFGKLLGQEMDPLKNVLVTVGAYGALFTAFQALVDEGDEVIITEPFFDCYEPLTLMAGGHPVFMPLKLSPSNNGELDSSSNWHLDPTELASKFTSRTKVLILHTANNPLGKVFSKAELELVASLCQQHDMVCISDEVYQWLVFDGNQHISITSLPGMWERTLTIGSAGKTFSATGWKVGWALSPDHLMKHLKIVHQNSVFHCPTQTQAAVAWSFEREQQHFGEPSSCFVQLPEATQHKRDHMVHSLQSVGLRPIISQGSYFLVTDISDFKSKMPDLPGAEDEAYDSRFIKWMIKNKGLMAMPVSVFYSVPHQKLFDHYIRFCFVKDEATLQAMDEKLQKWKAELTP
ncbi:PREDICTED: kynurenine--oxoglutarate transaminase 1-like [Elephantulus edwardii]|uniref:kynurenine--oxoglutarate transaminase 1-like n=1 Tax=Elephantulus edwardii TaxID=28737 RepID=UPI0003F0AD1B|nr:PREDICTED: kynurenine--oxoglutarate transaminase 1-like [Elephantulus edwardii]